MSIVDQIAQYIHNQGVGIFDPAGVGGNIFIGKLPQDPDEAIVLTQTGGVLNDIKHSYDTISVQVRVRGTQDPRTGLVIAESAYNYLHGFGSSTFVGGGTWVVSCTALGPPGSIGVDENGRYEYTINLHIEVWLKTIHRE